MIYELISAKETCRVSISSIWNGYFETKVISNSTCTNAK